MKQFKLILASLSLGLLIAACAQVMPLSGGEKDTTPPKIEKSSPENFSTHFTTNKITLEFDEYIVTKGLTQNVIVSPPLKNEPEYISKSKKVTMIINDTLAPNTTYNINFGEGIQDFTENNPLDSNVFVFSTGEYVDSLYFTGVVKDAYTLEPVGDVLVMAYQNLADSVPTVERPSYFSKTNKDGVFSINYMKEGNYRVFALKDLNKNYLFDLPNESMAFSDEVYSVLNTDTLDYRFFTPDFKQQYFKTKKAEFFGKVTVVFNRDLTNYQRGYSGSFRVLNNSVTEGEMIQEYHAADSLFLWFPQGLEDTLLLEAFDDTGIIDTLKLKLPSKEDFFEKVEKGKESFELDIDPSFENKTHHFFQDLYFSTNHPIAEYTYEKVIFSVAGDTVELDAEKARKGTLPASVGTHSTLRSKPFNFAWKPETQYGITFLPGAFTDVFGLTNDTVEFKFSTKRIEDYGNLKLAIEPKDAGNYYFELLKQGAKKPVDSGSFTGDTTLFYQFIEPSKYSVRLVYDSNADGKWSTGDYSTNQQPEKVVYYPDVIDVRANWDMELEWLISE